MVGVRSRDIVNQLEKEKEVAVNTVKKQLTSTLNKTISELHTVSKQKNKLEQENVDLRAQCIELLDIADEEEKKASKLGKYAKKVANVNHNLQKKVQRRDKKIQTLLDNFETDKEISKKLHTEIVTKLKESNENLKERLTDLQNLETKHKNHYNAEIWLVYFDLLSKGVSCNIIQSVVRWVLDTLGDKDVKNTSLPSRSTAQRMKVEAGYMVKLRLAWEWKQKANKDAIFQCNKTTKGQLEWLSTVIKLTPANNERRTFTLCMEPVALRTSEATLGTLQNCLDELGDIAVKSGIDTHDEARDTYSFTNIVGKMSDRASTETKLTKLLVVEKARQLQEKGIPEEELEKRKVYSFSCSLHKINNTAVAMTQAADKKLAFSKEEVSGTRHIYQTDKLICTESNKEYALGSKFRAYCLSTNQLEESGSTLFKPIVGGCYLIYAQNAVPTFCSKDLIMVFLQDLNEIKKLNRLEAGVYDGFLCKKVMAEVRALAILYHDILQPLYTEALHAATPLAVDYHFAVEKLELFSTHPCGLLRGNDPDIVRRHRDSCGIDIYMEKIREPSETDNDVLELLKVMCAAGAAKLKKHAEEHLPGGEYYWDDVNPNLIKAARIIGDSTNNTVEGRFASVDNQMTIARRSNPLSVAGSVLAKHDHLVDFLEGQDKDTQEMLCRSAMHGGRDLLKKWGTKQTQLKRLYEEAEPQR